MHLTSREHATATAVAIALALILTACGGGDPDCEQLGDEAKRPPEACQAPCGDGACK